MPRLLSVVCSLLLAWSPVRAATAAATTNSAPSVELPDLRDCVFTNVVARTNGRTTSFYRNLVHPPGWPTNAAPVMAWNPRALLTDWTGFNAMSMCNSFEGSHGQVRVTLLTRRHGYMRGHSAGGPPRTVRTNRAGEKCWFLTTNNVVVEAVVAADFIRFPWNGTPPDPLETNDWTILLFDRDLPPGIPSVPVISQADFHAYYPASPSNILFYVEQGGQCGAQANASLPGPLPHFDVNGWKGGDSGSPNFLPLPDGTLVFAGGRGTSFASPVMQADLDVLTRWAGLNTNDYQLRWVSLTNYLRH